MSVNDVEKWISLLTNRWSTVPASGHERVSSEEMLKLSDSELVDCWRSIRDRELVGNRFAVRGWYHELYREQLKGRRVLDVGSGLGIDGLSFAQHGAQVTFLDLVETNLELLERLSFLLNIPQARFCFFDSLRSLDVLDEYDFIWAQGSLINAPLSVIREESLLLLDHLQPGGRWIELGYPRVRWEREGSLPFEEWGTRTDGEGTPWVEWYDLEKMALRFSPIIFDIVFYHEFHNNDFNWFDLLFRKR